jgi:hypothetical protein
MCGVSLNAQFRKFWMMPHPLDPTKFTHPSYRILLLP